jgi:hypothetical protein
MKKTILTHLFSLIVVLAIVIACDSDDGPATDAKNVYVAGKESFWARCWKNGTKVDLTNGSIVSAITGSKGDVYIAGSTNPSGIVIAHYWKNGKDVQLTDGTKHGDANAIFVSGSDVYVAGYYGGPVYWKNETLQPGLATSNSGAAFGIAVVDGDVHVVGTRHNGSTFIATYWKNGIAKPLTSGPSAAFGVDVDGTDVYVAGYENKTAMYWKNEDPVPLTDGINYAQATAIAVSGDDVYVAGYEYNGTWNVAKYWKNGEAIILTDGTKNGLAKAIAVVGENVYVAGVEGGLAMLWKNSVPTALSDPTVGSDARGIYLQY